MNLLKNVDVPLRFFFFFSFLSSGVFGARRESVMGSIETTTQDPRYPCRGPDLPVFGEANSVEVQRSQNGVRRHLHAFPGSAVVFSQARGRQIQPNHAEPFGTATNSDVHPRVSLNPPTICSSPRLSLYQKTHLQIAPSGPNPKLNSIILGPSGVILINTPWTNTRHGRRRCGRFVCLQLFLWFICLAFLPDMS